MGQVASGMQDLGSAFANPATFAASPSGFSGAEWAARFMGDTAKGLGQGYSSYQQQNQMQRRMGGNGVSSGGPNPTPMISPQIYDPTAAGGPSTGQAPFARSRNPYFYGTGS